MIPPPAEDTTPAAENPPHGSLLVGWNGGLEKEEDIGAGFRARFELDARGIHTIPWGAPFTIDGRGGAAFRVSILRPTVLTLPGTDIRVTPSASLSLGVKSGAEEDSYRPAVTFRLALNDLEDRVSFKPNDELLVQLLPSDGLSLPIDAALEWTLEHGWRFAGVGQIASAVLVDTEAPLKETPAPRDPNADFDDPPPGSPLVPTEVVTPMNTRLGPVTLHERRFEVTTAVIDGRAALNIAVTATVSVNIGPVRIAVSGLGVRGSLLLATEFDSARRIHRLLDRYPDADRPRGLDRHRRDLGRRLPAAHRLARRRGDVARRPRAASRRALRRQRLGRRRDRRRTPVHADRVPRRAILAADSPDRRLEARRSRRPRRAEPDDERQRVARCGNRHARHTRSGALSRSARAAVPRAASRRRAVLPTRKRSSGRRTAGRDRMARRDRHEVRRLPARAAWRVGDVSVRLVRHGAARIPEGRQPAHSARASRRPKRSTTIGPSWRASR